MENKVKLAPAIVIMSFIIGCLVIGNILLGEIIGTLLLVSILYGVGMLFILCSLLTNKIKEILTLWYIIVIFFMAIGSSVYQFRQDDICQIESSWYSGPISTSCDCEK